MKSLRRLDKPTLQEIYDDDDDDDDGNDDGDDDDADKADDCSFVPYSMHARGVDRMQVYSL